MCKVKSDPDFLIEAVDRIHNSVWSAIQEMAHNAEDLEWDMSIIGDISDYIEEKLKALPWQLSGGQQQRAAIGRALMARPLLLLADEPTGNLDRRNAREIMDLFHLFHRNFHQTILFVTHDEKLALEAERIITLEDGQIVSDRKVR